MPVKWSKNQTGAYNWKRCVFNWWRKVCNDDNETMASGRPFQTWAAASGKAWRQEVPWRWITITPQCWWWETAAITAPAK